MSEETELSIKQKELAALKADPNPDKRKIADLESYIRLITPNPYSNKDGIPTPAENYVPASNYIPNASPYTGRPSLMKNLGTLGTIAASNIANSRVKGGPNSRVKGGRKTKKRKTKKSKRNNRRKTHRRK